MKKKVNLQQIVAGALATTFLVESCTKYPDLYYEPASVPDINQRYNSLSTPSPFSVLRIPITEAEKDYLVFINYLLEDILTDPQKAKDFMNAPDRYALEAGFDNIRIDLNDDVLQYIVAISDTEIRDAVINKDITKFLKLCKEKNIIKNFDIANSPILKGILEKNPSINQFIADAEELEKTSFVAFAVAVVAGVAVFVWAVAVTHVVATNVAVAVTAVETVAALSHVTISHPKGFYNCWQDEFFLQLWKINGGDPEQTYVLLSEYTESQINSAIEALKQTYPEKFGNINDNDFRQFIALNVQKLLE